VTQNIGSAADAREVDSSLSSWKAKGQRELGISRPRRKTEAPSAGDIN